MNIQNNASLKLPMPQPALVDEHDHDPLADVLLYLASHHGRAITKNALTAGLPITGRLNAALFDRAAKRAGLEAEAGCKDALSRPLPCPTGPECCSSKRDGSGPYNGSSGLRGLWIPLSSDRTKKP